MTAQGATRPGRAPAPEGVARLVTDVRSDGRPVSLVGHQQTFGPLAPGADLIELVEASRLRDRGGGSFPAST